MSNNIKRSTLQRSIHLLSLKGSFLLYLSETTTLVITTNLFCFKSIRFFFKSVYVYMFCIFTKPFFYFRRNIFYISFIFFGLTKGALMLKQEWLNFKTLFNGYRCKVCITFTACISFSLLANSQVFQQQRLFEQCIFQGRYIVLIIVNMLIFLLSSSFQTCMSLFLIICNGETFDGVTFVHFTALSLTLSLSL